MLGKTWDPKDAAHHYKDYGWEGFAVVMTTNACFLPFLGVLLTCWQFFHRLLAFWSLLSAVTWFGALVQSGSTSVFGLSTPRACLSRYVFLCFSIRMEISLASHACPFESPSFRFAWLTCILFQATTIVFTILQPVTLVAAAVWQALRSREDRTGPIALPDEDPHEPNSHRQEHGQNVERVWS